LADRMAGPAIRAFHIADVLSCDHEVKLVSTTHCSLSERPERRFDCLHAPYAKMYPLVEWAEIVIFQGFVMHFLPWLAGTDKLIVADVYDPMHLEQLEQLDDSDPAERWNVIRATTTVLNDQLARGDFFICASETQRKFWLGQLAALGRVNPLTYDRDSSLTSLIAVCPFGLSAEPPKRERAAIKGVVPGIDETDKVIIWAGGVYNWLDPCSVISAVDIVCREHPEVKLFFLGMQHPNPDVPMMRAAHDARVLANELGLLDKHVFFNAGWVEYDDRQNFLLDADLGISTHFEHVETTFSFRTRILDYLWANLPIVATGGDTFGDLITAEGLGVAVRERDKVALAEAITKVLFDDGFNACCRANVARVRQDFVWERALAPLVDYCRQAEPAADRTALGGAPIAAMRAQAALVGGSVLQRNLHYARVRLREGGVPMVVKQGVAKAGRLVRQRLDR
jgi:glycosyltransferase involved in cell wall biosynthesis